jgi:cell division protein ZapA (FtsZ GTPase activity inhibitor)
MTMDELTKQFDDGIKLGLQILKDEGREMGQIDQVVVAGLLFLKEFLVDHKRIADALEHIAERERELDEYKRLFGSINV